jgi:hypothetical protein
VDVTTASSGAFTIPLTNAGGLYTIQTAGQPIFRFPTNLTSGEYGTFWTITNGFVTGGQRIIIESGIFKLTIPGSVLTCPQNQNPNQSINLGLAPGQSITFVFFAGSGSSAEYIAF